jgi:DNA modification methylase
MVELIWDGKYKDGKKQGPVRIALPFQTIETVNESAQERQRSLELFSAGREPEWRNRLIWGDKKYVLPSLLPEFAGKVNLIYIDPPFDTGQDFSFNATIPQTDRLTFLKEPSILEQKAYRDTWGRGIDSYLQWFYETAVLLHELLADDGSFYGHFDENVGHYAKAVLDEVFGLDGFQREIVWRIGWISGYKSAAKNWIRNHDLIFFYTKNKNGFTFNKEYVPYPPGYKRRGEEGPPPEGKGYPIEDVWNANQFEFALKGEESMDSIQIKSFSVEKTGFPTQKNESLVRRIIRASSNEGDLVLDCFVGSGTTAVVAEKLNRRWIACDLSRFAIHTTRKRLLGIPNVRPFVVQNLGKYERQAWQVAEFPANGKDRLEEQREREAAYRQFILELYHAKPITGHTWLHGVKGGRMVHVGAVDAPVTLADVKAIARETWKAIGTGKDTPTKAAVDILGWEFAFEVNELAKQVAAESRVDVAFKKIPREVLDKKAVEQGDVQFFELGALSVDVKQEGREVRLKLTDFVIPTDDIPEEARKAIKHWSQLVDYWAVDWDYKGDTFHNQWQSYRTRKNPKIELETKYTYPGPGKYVVVVKVIDILGNDTTKTLEVNIR